MADGSNNTVNVALTPVPVWSASYTASPPTSWASGQSQTFSVTLTNNGANTWNSGGTDPVHFGVHFLAAPGECCTWYTDQRFTLPNDVASGGSVTLSVTITPPSTQTGTMTLELQMVKENEFWFTQHADTMVTVT